MNSSKKRKSKHYDPEFLKLSGVKENNLKNLDISIEHNTFNVITGPSGSGKTSLAFDTIHAEGGRRYIETFSPYTRQFLDRLKQPELESCSGVRASLALEQRNRITSTRSTVGTITEINDYLKIIWSECSVVVCPKCEIEVNKKDASKIADEILKEFTDCIITFKLKTEQSSLESLAETLSKSGFSRIYDTNKKEIIKIEELGEFKQKVLKLKEVYIAVDRFKKLPRRQRLISSVSQALNFGKNQIHCFSSNKEKTYSSGFKCSKCFEEFKNPRPSMFTYNSAIGACSSCAGFGATLETDPKLVIKDPSKSIKKGAVSCWDTKSTKHLKKRLLDYCAKSGIPIDIAWSKLKSKDKDKIFSGDASYKGIQQWFDRLKKKRHKMHVRIMLAKFRSEFTCKECEGNRLKTDSLNYKIKNLSISDFSALAISDSLEFAKKNIKSNLQAYKQLISRLEYLSDIGLSYLTLHRQSKTLSGGESQRVGLTSILGAELSNTTLVLDEPTIGLHSSDTKLLIDSIKKLKEKNNTVVVVEHDLEVIKSADKVIDIGPESGELGGELVNYCSPKDLKKCKKSKTSIALNEVVKLNSKNKFKPKKYLKVSKLNKNNLKNIDAKIPLNCITTLVGVSGSGKSSLVAELVERYKENKTKGDVDDIVFINQAPIGKTPRSNAGTYTKAWDSIRELLSRTDKAIKLGLSKSSFSFNVDAGRCTNCSGAGYQKVEMQFLPDVFVECEQCGGTRFQDSIRTVKYKDKNVNDFLNMTLDDVISFFKAEEEKLSKSIIKSITPLCNLGLGYLRLGQPLSTVSGGEAQRIKIASYLTNSKNTLFILDEPTTGLHSCDINYLVKSLRELVEHGNSVLCVEHNLKLISQSDWIIELGPKAGKDGGEIIAEGHISNLKTPTTEAFLSKAKKSTKKDVNKVTNKNYISIKGARENNLKNFDIEIPKNEINLITGVSGSGKSTLAFSILFAEGQRRYIDCLSPYARQYIKQLKHPNIDSISNISPTIAVSQKTSPPMGVSTIATITEVYQFLRLLFSKLGTQLCPEHKKVLSSNTTDSIANLLCEKHKGKRIFLFAPAVQGRKGIYNDLFNRALNAEINIAKIDDEIIGLSEDLRLERNKLHWISLLVASITVNKNSKKLITSALEQCLILGNGSIEISISSASNDSEILSIDRTCPTCEKGFLPLDPQDFSFRSKRGMCKKCHGYGYHEDETVCKECTGQRLGPIARNVLLQGKSIHDLHQMKSAELKKFIKNLKFSKNLHTVLDPISKELIARLDMIEKIGLDYISLSRESSTLSGGDAQRLRLAKSIGSDLTGVCYVLDEPSIGLHSADQEVVLKTLQELKEQGNTLVVVEHDEDTILNADNIFDFGPGGGKDGGGLVATGSPEEILKSETSPTGKALRNKTSFVFNKSKLKAKYFELSKANANNLKNINVNFPLNKLSVVAGVSGAGKSSLIHHTLIPEIINDFDNKKSNLKNLSNINRYVEVDQKPIGKTSTSTPASYLGIFDQIRKVFANTNESKTRGLKAGYFSYNTGKGKCEDCSGKGFNKIPMSFLPDAITDCEVCNTKRYNEQALEITYLGKNISEILNLTFNQASLFFKNHSKIKRTVDCVLELGIGYLKLGQPSYTLSGGEAQRIKIANELGMRVAENTLYVLDEPTVGLHMSDVDKLIKVLKGLTENNNTVIVIEHNLDVIKSADYLIELGPKAGDAGGDLLFAGTPWELKSGKLKTPTKGYL